MANRSLLALRQIETGIDPRDVLTLQVDLSGGLRGDDTGTWMAFDEIRARVAALPGVRQAAFVSHLPLLGAANGTSLYPEGSPPPLPGREPWVITKQSQPGYFQAMGIRLVDGRDFTETDGSAGTAPVIIVNEAFARRYWPGERAVGKRVKYGSPESDFPWMEIVGVAGDVHHFGPGRPVELGIYEPFHQLPYWREALVVRGEENPSVLVPGIRAIVREVDPDAPVHDIQTMTRIWYRTNWHMVLTSRLLWVFSTVALLLASLGVFGVVSFLTAQRRREFAIRMAAGADRRMVVVHAVRSTLPSLLLGITGGTLVAWGGIRIWASLLFGGQEMDPWVLGLCILAMGLLMGTAILLPARRAARLDPARVLGRE